MRGKKEAEEKRWMETEKDGKEGEEGNTRKKVK